VEQGFPVHQMQNATYLNIIPQTHMPCIFQYTNFTRWQFQYAIKWMSIHTWNFSHPCSSPTLLSTFSSLFQQCPVSWHSLWCDVPSSACSTKELWDAAQLGAPGSPYGIPDHSRSNRASRPAKVSHINPGQW